MTTMMHMQMNITCVLEFYSCPLGGSHAITAKLYKKSAAVKMPG